MALYAFSNPGEAKYLSQHIDSDICMVNQIPLPLLGKWVCVLVRSINAHRHIVGPCIPVGSSQSADINIRYDANVMSKPAPQWIHDLSSSSTDPRQFCQHASTPLKPVKQHSGFDIGFFDRGALVGAVVIVLPSICALVYGGYRVVASGYRHFI